MNFLAKIIPPHYLNKLNFNLASNVLLLLIALLIALSFKQYGASNDELVQHTYGQLLVKFYASAGQDLSAFSYKNLYLYGGFFDLLAAGLEPDSPWLVWDLRQLLAALFGLAVSSRCSAAPCCWRVHAQHFLARYCYRFVALGQAPCLPTPRTLPSPPVWRGRYISPY